MGIHPVAQQGAGLKEERWEHLTGGFYGRATNINRGQYARFIRAATCGSSKASGYET